MQMLHVDDNVTAVTVKAHAKKITQTCNTPQKLYTATGQLQCYSGEMRKNSRVTMMKKLHSRIETWTARVSQNSPFDQYTNIRTIISKMPVLQATGPPLLMANLSHLVQ